MTISFSRLASFMTCPQLFAEEYLLGRRQPESPDMQHGRLVHALLARHFGGSGAVSPDDQALLAAADPAEMSRAESQTNRVIAMWPASPVVAVERPFTIPLLPDVSLRGRIDLIEEHPGGLTVIDWKTVNAYSKFVLDAAAARHAVTLQATIYYEAAKALYPPPVSNKVHFVSITDTGVHEEVIELTEARIASDRRTINWYCARLEELLNEPPELWPYNRDACVRGTRLCPFYDAHKEAGIITTFGAEA